jgi:GNAT superfamily N-acetyltransferase
MSEMARFAGRNDIDDLAKLYRAWVDEHLAQRGGSLFVGEAGLSEPFAQTIGALIDDAACCVVAGDYGDAVVGFALAGSGAHNDGRPSGQALLRMIYVDRNARNVGVGEAMLGEVVTWCKSKGYVGLSVPVLPGAREAKSFLEEMSFRARLLFMHRDLGAR